MPRLLPAALLASILTAPAASQQGPADPYRDVREAMVEHQIKARGVADRRVLEAIRQVPRHEFVPEALQQAAYFDRPLPIGEGQTISQPYIVAIMSELLGLDPDHKVLEIGTGSGYQAAVLSLLAGEVHSVEIVPSLVERVRPRLTRLGYDNVHVHLGDGYKGWPAAAPFDRIIVTAAPPEMPQALIDQLKPGGRLVAPVGPRDELQELIVLTKTAAGKTRKRSVMPVVFVPMVPGAERSQPDETQAQQP